MADEASERREHLYWRREWLNDAEHRMAAIAVDLSREPKKDIEGSVMISDCFHTIRLEFGDGQTNDLHKLDVLLSVLSDFRQALDRHYAETNERRPG